MLSTSAPTKISVPFGNSGSKNTIPVASQIGIVDGAASYTDGFPPLTYTDPTAGGIAPAAQDFNGILFAITQQLQWTEAGGLPKFDSAFSTAVGGYPAGSILQSADSFGFWISAADNNTANPDTGGAGWVPHFFYGNTTQAAAGAAITLTNVQASKPMIIVSGTLTANVAITFPTWIKQWLVVNNTTGAFALTAKTSTGTAVTLLPGSNLLYGDGSNVLHTNVVVPGTFTANQSLSNPGYQKFPGGLIHQWGTTASFTADTASNPVTFPIPFPTSCLVVTAQPSTNNGINVGSTNYAWGIYGKTASGFYINNDAIASTFDWFAIGK